MTSHDALIAELEAAGQYRVLRRLQERTPDLAEAEEGALGIVLDCETTGLDPATDEIIELAMLPFRYRPDGTICHVGAAFHSYREPSRPIPPEMTAIHGLTDDVVRGHRIDPNQVAALIASAAPIIAHNADFDRRFCERLIPAFCDRPWACSQKQIDWRAEGFDSTGLGYLGLANGFFYNRHHAATDCAALLELLGRTLPRSGVRVLSRLLETGRKTTYRIYADNSPFDLKDILKRRGYSWNPDQKVWWIDAADVDTEIAWLSENIYRRSVDLRPHKITAFTRFSDRIEHIPNAVTEQPSRDALAERPAEPEKVLEPKQALAQSQGVPSPERPRSEIWQQSSFEVERHEKADHRIDFDRLKNDLIWLVGDADDPAELDKFEADNEVNLRRLNEARPAFAVEVREAFAKRRGEITGE